MTIFITASHSSPLPSSEGLSPFQEGGVIWRNGVIASGPKGMDAVMQRVHHGGRYFPHIMQYILCSLGFLSGVNVNDLFRIISCKTITS